MISPLPGREKTISVDYSEQGGLENAPVAVSINKIKVIKNPYLGLKELFGRRFEIIDEGVSHLFA